MPQKPITVSDLAALIHAREETRAELHLLAVRAYEQWCELEAKLEQLEARMNRSCNQLSDPAVGGLSALPGVASLGRR